MVEPMLKLVVVEDGYTLEGDGMEPTLLKMNGRSAQLSAGWVPTSASRLDGTLIALNMMHLDGQEATWLLDSDCNYISGTIGNLPNDPKRSLLNTLKIWHEAVAQEFLTHSDFANRDGLSEYFAIAAAVRNDILQLNGIPEPDAPDVITLKSYEPLEVTTSSGSYKIPIEHIRSCLETPVDKRLTSACRKGVIEWTSPIDGSVITDVRGFALSHILMAWRCVDKRSELVYFVIAAGFSSASLSLWIPVLNKLIVPDILRHGQISIATDTTYLKPIIKHLFSLGRELIPFMRRPTARVAHYTWPMPAVHVGHYHWNELPGLEKIVELLNPEHYPIIYDLGGASGNCFYEQLTQLYPEFCNVIDYSAIDLDQMSRHAYRRGIQPIKFAGSFVSREIRNRVQRAVSLHPAHVSAVEFAAKTKGPIIVIGLRVENRTASNLADFYVSLTRGLADHYGQLTVVIDGHNTKAGSQSEAFISNEEQKATSKPIEVERRMVKDIKERLNDSRITLVDCVGMTLRENLAWLQISDFCVAPWGAGLAKYRWVLNIPTYIMSNEYCMSHKGDMNIYSSPEFMEAPSWHTFITKSLVTDQPDAPVLIDIGGNYKAYYANYFVEPENSTKEIISAFNDVLKQKYPN